MDCWSTQGAVASRQFPIVSSLVRFVLLYRTEYHRLGNRNLILIVLEADKSKIKAPASGEGFFFCCVRTWQKAEGQERTNSSIKPRYEGT